MTGLLLGLVLVLVATVQGEGLQSPDTVEPRPTSEAEPGELLVKANAAYEEGDFGGAVRGYRQLLESGVENGHLYYNLGNAYLRSGELGQAIASFRRSLRLQPRNRDALANLEFARRSARDAIAPPAPSAVLTTLFFWHYSFSRTELLRAALILNVLFWGLLCGRLLRRDSELLRWSSYAALLLLVVTGSSLVVHAARPQPVAVVIPQEVDVHSGTDPETVVRFKLHAGTEIEVTDRRPGWVRIRLPEGEEGWVEAEHVEIVGAS